MLAAKEKQFSAISNLCSTLRHLAGFRRAPQHVLSTPIKDSP
jgi:hypothetical protein